MICIDKFLTSLIGFSSMCPYENGFPSVKYSSNLCLYFFHFKPEIYQLMVFYVNIMSIPLGIDHMEYESCYILQHGRAIIGRQVA